MKRAGKSTLLRNSTFSSDIHDAARLGNDDMIVSLLESGVDINSAQSEGLTPLMVAACLSDRRSTLELLLKKGADVNRSDQNKRTALMHAVNCHKKEEAKMLIRKGADIDAVDKHGISALMKACHVGDVGIVNYLLKRNAATKFREKRSGNTAILIALGNRCMKKSYHIVQLLIEHGADPNAKNKEGTTGLYYSALMGHTACLSLFLQYSKKSLVNFLRCDAGENESCLHQAATRDDKVMASLLLSHGADIDLRTGNHIGNTPLMCAAYKGHTRMVQFLLDRGADLHKGDKCGCTAVMHAASVSQVDTVRLLLDRGAHIENSDGMSALMFAMITPDREREKDTGTERHKDGRLVDKNPSISSARLGISSPSSSFTVANGSSSSLSISNGSNGHNNGSSSSSSSSGNNSNNNGSNNGSNNDNNNGSNIGSSSSNGIDTKQINTSSSSSSGSGSGRPIPGSSSSSGKRSSKRPTLEPDQDLDLDLAKVQTIQLLIEKGADLNLQCMQGISVADLCTYDSIRQYLLKAIDKKAKASDKIVAPSASSRLTAGSNPTEEQQFQSIISSLTGTLNALSMTQKQKQKDKKDLRDQMNQRNENERREVREQRNRDNQSSQLLSSSIVNSLANLSKDLENLANDKPIKYYKAVNYEKNEKSVQNEKAVKVEKTFSSEIGNEKGTSNMSNMSSDGSQIAERVVWSERSERGERSERDMKNVCVNCQAYSSSFKKCGACAAASPTVDVCYCSVECQKAHWPTHKLTCLRPKTVKSKPKP